MGLPEFDLIVCDEAHRTTGVTFAGEDQSHFVKVHDNDVIRGRKRIYMTATPRIYGENARSKAHEADAILASMDDQELFGDVLFHHGFARAVESKILTDYRVIVLAMDEGVVSAAVQKRLADENSELTLDDATKIAGCWKALSKAGLKGLAADDTDPMRRALAFCRDIKSSKMVRDEFGRVIVDYREKRAGHRAARGVRVRDPSCRRNLQGAGAQAATGLAEGGRRPRRVPNPEQCALSHRGRRCSGPRCNYVPAPAQQSD